MPFVLCQLILVVPFLNILLLLKQVLHLLPDKVHIVLESGLGGRLDATNVFLHPLLTIITSISYDHTEILGDTLEKIAFEKAGIIKEKTPVGRHKQNLFHLYQLHELLLLSFFLFQVCPIIFLYWTALFFL